MERVSLNGVKVYPFTSTDELLAYVSQRKGILVAINAGKIYHATDQLRDLINNNIGYIDGAGALKAVKYKGVKNAIKIPGCELWLNIIERKYKSGCSFYLIGGKQDVIDDTISLLHRQFPGIQIVGYRNGYIKEEEYEPLLMDVASKKPDYVFVAMGSPKQELLMNDMFLNWPAVYQGLGGSFDLYTGRAKRAPKWFIEHNLEGFYRMVTSFNMVRLKRYLDDIKFMFNLYRGKY